VEVLEEDPVAAAVAMAETIAASSSHSVRNTKKIVRRILDGQAEDDAETQALFGSAFLGEDFKEGVSAFLEKRKAVFK
jgi:enoyl-CoA hydratase/carnithine racemase